MFLISFRLVSLKLTLVDNPVRQQEETLNGDWSTKKYFLEFLTMILGALLWSDFIAISIFNKFKHYVATD